MLSLICSCTVPVPDIEICADQGSEGATCTWTNSDKIEDIPYQAWGAKRFGQLCMSANDFGAIKATIEKLCHQSNNCTQEIQNNINSLFVKLEALNQSN